MFSKFPATVVAASQGLQWWPIKLPQVSGVARE